LRLPGRAGKALARSERGPGTSIGSFGEGGLLGERLLLGMRQVEMPQAMASDLEQRICDQLLRALGMGLHPFAAGEEGRLDALHAQKIDHAAVIPRHIAVLLAEIEG
jgi:hypothetical protein